MQNRIRYVLIVLGAMAVAMELGVLIGDQEWFGLAVVVAAVVGLCLLPNPAWVGFFVVALYYSGLTAPGVPGKLDLFYLSAIGLVLIVVTQLAMQRLQKMKWSASHSMTVAFGMVLVVTILVRGAGFRVLGSGTWGGMVYVQLFICMLLVVALPQAGIESKWWPRAVFLMGVLSILPLAADTAILMGVDPAKVWQVVHGSQSIGLSMQADVAVQQGVVRYFSAGVAGPLLLVAFLALVNINSIFTLRRIWLLPLFPIFFAVTMVGGFRLALVQFVFILFLVACLQRAFTVPRIFFGIFAAVVSWYALVETSPYLPPGAQRAISWMPGVNIPVHVTQDATGTVEWRLDLWREAMKKLPEYWLIGKGYAFSEKEAVAVTGANMSTDPIAWAMVTSSYHNGPISLLLGLGIFGLLVGVTLMVAVCIRHGRLLRRPWENPSLKQCHQVIYAMLLVTVILFFTIYGDVPTTFPLFFFMFALLEGLCAADKAQTAQKPAKSRRS